MAPAKILLTFLSASTLIATTAIAHSDDNQGRKFTVELTGEAEVTAAGVPNQGDLDGTGTAQVTVNVGKNQVCYSLEVAGIAPATAAHIHAAPSTTTGGVVVTLAAPADGDSSGCVEIAKDLAKKLISSPKSYYVNVHNAEFASGALRGQLG